MRALLEARRAARGADSADPTTAAAAAQDQKPASLMVLEKGNEEEGQPLKDTPRKAARKRALKVKGCGFGCEARIDETDTDSFIHA